jgi:hypothetical protein
VIAAALSIMLAQTCATLLPRPSLEVEWLRNGKPYARAVPVEATSLTRSYRRTSAAGERSVRTVSCTHGDDGVVLTETINSDRVARLPLSLKRGEVMRVDGVLVTRIWPPVNAATNAFWFFVASGVARIYGVREGVGIVEIRQQSATGNVDVYRAFARKPAPVEVKVPDNVVELEAELARLQTENTALQDSIAQLTDELRMNRAAAVTEPGASPPGTKPVAPGVLNFEAVDEYVLEGKYAAAISLLVDARAQLTEYERLSGTMHPALPGVLDRLDRVVRACRRAHPESPAACALR